MLVFQLCPLKKGKGHSVGKVWYILVYIYINMIYLFTIYIYLDISYQKYIVSLSGKGLIVLQCLQAIIPKLLWEQCNDQGRIEYPRAGPQTIWNNTNPNWSYETFPGDLSWWKEVGKHGPSHSPGKFHGSGIAPNLKAVPSEHVQILDSNRCSMCTGAVIHHVIVKTGLWYAA